jgi:hypothetical protein
MNIITFRAAVDGEQVIRPPSDVVLPQGMLEVTIRPVAGDQTVSSAARAAANERLRQHRVSLGRATGIDNEAIDADLARLYGGELDSSKP